MRLTTTVACMTVLLLCATSRVIAQAGDGYVGIYTDPDGITPCAEIPQLSADVLYIVAKVDGITAGGISGTEFRIEVTNPAGWSFSVSFYNSPIQMGDVLGSGVNLAYSSCQPAETDSTVLIGHITVFNIAGGPTDLLVMSHGSPSNPQYPCPLLLACDAPTFTKACMTSSPEPPCSILVPSKPRISSPGEQIVFSFALNRIAPPTVQPFSEVVDLGNSELWVGGRRVGSGSITFSFDGTRLLAGSTNVPLGDPPKAPSTAALSNTYGQVPSITARVRDGMPILQASQIFLAESAALERQVSRRLRRGEIEEARRLLNESPLVERADVESQGATIYYRGVPWGEEVAARYPETFRPTPPSAEEIARNVLSGIKDCAGRNELVLFIGGSTLAWSGSRRSQVESQLTHIRAGGRPTEAPAGPLTPELLDRIQKDR